MYVYLHISLYIYQAECWRFFISDASAKLPPLTRSTPLTLWVCFYMANEATIIKAVCVCVWVTLWSTVAVPNNRNYSFLANIKPLWLLPPATRPLLLSLSC